MELLQKLTLYDLLGYTLPGVAFLGICISNGFLPELEQAQDSGAVYWCAIIILGYIVGIIMTELMELCGKLCKKIGLNKQYSDQIMEIYGISELELKKALEKSKGMNIEQCNNGGELLHKYRSYIYSDIQMDEQYSRLHNYASAELLYKNMTFVFAAALVMAVLQLVWSNIIISVIGMVCFLIRFRQFHERKIGYAACWFVQKYL